VDMEDTQAEDMEDTQAAHHRHTAHLNSQLNTVHPDTLPEKLSELNLDMFNKDIKLLNT
jgi:hypothetical protein